MPALSVSTFIIFSNSLGKGSDEGLNMADLDASRSASYLSAAADNAQEVVVGAAGAQVKNNGWAAAAATAESAETQIHPDDYSLLGRGFLGWNVKLISRSPPPPPPPRHRARPRMSLVFARGTKYAKIMSWQ